MDDPIDNDFLNAIPKLVIEEDNQMLMEPFTLEEIKMETFQLYLDKVSGPNGLPKNFFHNFWGFMGDNIHRVVKDVKKKWEICKGDQ